MAPRGPEQVGVLTLTIEMCVCVGVGVWVCARVCDLYQVLMSG